MDYIAIKHKFSGFFRKYRYVVLVLIIGIVLMLIPSKENNTAQTQEVIQPQVQQNATITQELSQILEKIEGAGKVEVMLTIFSGEQTVYQQDESISGNEAENYDRETVIITDDNRAQAGLIQQINPPKYQGAIIVCQGADRADVRLSMIEAVSKVTGLGTDRISVLKMK